MRKSQENLEDLCDTIKRSTICNMKSPETEEKNKRTESILKQK